MNYLFGLIPGNKIFNITYLIENIKKKTEKFGFSHERRSLRRYWIEGGIHIID